MQSQNNRWSLFVVNGKPFNITVTQVYAPTINAKEAEVEQFCDDLQDLLELKLEKKKRCPVYHRNWNAKSRDTWSKRQVWPWSTKWSRAKANRVLPRECILDIANAILHQHKRRLYTWTSPDGQHQNQIDYILCSQRWRSSYSQQKQDQELTVAQTMNSLLPNLDLNWRK